jgi:hypothetical protein
MILLFVRVELQSLFYQNVAFISLSHALASSSSATDRLLSFRKSESLLQKALSANRASPEIHRGLGFVYWAYQEDERALAEWRLAGWSVDDAVFLGKAGDDWANSLRWFRVAEQFDPMDSALWLEVGKICQKEPELDNICTRFIEHNEGNWLLDPDFDYEWQGWDFNSRSDVLFDIDSCPDLTDHRCATIKIGPLNPEQGAGIQQCVRLFPGKSYHYTAWLKVTSDGKWLPLYYQGNINGQAAGRWPGDQIGSQDWTLWERIFLAEEFDSRQACFHPVRLASQGQVWFYGARLTEID